MCTCISSSVQTFLSIFKLRTFEMLGPNPLCSPETQGSYILIICEIRYLVQLPDNQYIP